MVSPLNPSYQLIIPQLLSPPSSSSQLLPSQALSIKSYHILTIYLNECLNPKSFTTIKDMPPVPTSYIITATNLNCRKEMQRKFLPY